MTSQIINSLGLILDFAGAALIWHFGLPPDVNRKGESALLLESTDQSEIDKASRYDFRSSIGFVCLMVGAFLQFLSNWVGR